MVQNDLFQKIIYAFMSVDDFGITFKACKKKSSS